MNEVTLHELAIQFNDSEFEIDLDDVEVYDVIFKSLEVLSM